MKHKVPDKESREIEHRGDSSLATTTCTRCGYEQARTGISQSPQNVTRPFAHVSTLRLLSSISPFILYYSNDQGFLEHNADDSIIGRNIEFELYPDRKHDFVMHPDMVLKPVDFCV